MNREQANNLAKTNLGINMAKLRALLIQNGRNARIKAKYMQK